MICEQFTAIGRDFPAWQIGVEAVNDCEVKFSWQRTAQVMLLGCDELLDGVVHITDERETRRGNDFST